MNGHSIPTYGHWRPQSNVFPSHSYVLFPEINSLVDLMALFFEYAVLLQVFIHTMYGIVFLNLYCLKVVMRIWD